jgi:hypothetical protein
MAAVAVEFWRDSDVTFGAWPAIEAAVADHLGQRDQEALLAAAGRQEVRRLTQSPAHAGGAASLVETRRRYLGDVGRHLSQIHEADELLTNDPLALLIALVLDRQIG